MPKSTRALLRTGICCLLVLAGAGAVLGQAPRGDDPRALYEGRSIRRAGQPGVQEGVGMVQYEPGAPPDAVAINGAPLSFYGNRFDTRNGSPLSPGIVTRISWFAGARAQAGTFSPVWWAPTNGSANFLGCCNGIVTNTFNSLTTSIVVPAPFWAGVHVYAPSLGYLGLRSTSTNGQGFHLQRRLVAPTPVISITVQNAMVRVSGDIVIPVELLDFDVE